MAASRPPRRVTAARCLPRRVICLQIRHRTKKPVRYGPLAALLAPGVAVRRCGHAAPAAAAAFCPAAARAVPDLAQPGHPARHRGQVAGGRGPALAPGGAAQPAPAVVRHVRPAARAAARAARMDRDAARPGRAAARLAPAPLRWDGRPASPARALAQADALVRPARPGHPAAARRAQRPAPAAKRPCRKLLHPAGGASAAVRAAWLPGCRCRPDGLFARPRFQVP